MNHQAPADKAGTTCVLIQQKGNSNGSLLVNYGVDSNYKMNQHHRCVPFNYLQFIIHFMVIGINLNRSVITCRKCVMIE